MSAYAVYPSLKDKVVFITGGASGIGACFVEGFHQQGAKVGFIDRDGAEGRALADKLEGSWFAACDVTDAPALEKAIADCAQALGPIGALINNVANDTRKAAVDTTAEQWRAGLAVNLDPVFIASRAVYPGMKAAGGGTIVNISSINAILGPALLANYVAAKGAINAMTKTLAREWGPDNIRVNVISPGWVVTPRQLRLWLTPQAEADWMKLVDLQRRIAPGDVARLALFLAADDSAVITGQNMVIDGGRT
jgi:NAD(P)-dependent dehydrogenase (short-subunit alcohol dehydrogenase family)